MEAIFLKLNSKIKYEIILNGDLMSYFFIVQKQIGRVIIFIKCFISGFRIWQEIEGIILKI